MSLIKNFVNWGIYFESITYDVKSGFIWYKIEENKEISLTEEEINLLMLWFMNYPIIFSKNSIIPFQINFTTIPKKRFINPSKPLIIIESVKLKTNDYRVFPPIEYNLPFNIVGYEI